MAKFTLTCEFSSKEELYVFLAASKQCCNSTEADDDAEYENEVEESDDYVPPPMVNYSYTDTQAQQEQKTRRRRRTKAEIEAERAKQQAEAQVQPVVQEEKPVVREESAAIEGELMPVEVMAQVPQISPQFEAPISPVVETKPEVPIFAFGIPNFNQVVPPATVVTMQPTPTVVAAVAPPDASASGLPADLLGALGGKF